ncbi:MAG: hypothetical protein K2Y51_20085 [Gammaproteobacteria bacterium]|nr:hypothetical protein [Gammaproteobacteria bacterium]
MDARTLGVLLAASLLGLGGCTTELRKPVVECSFPSQAPPPPGSALVATQYGSISPIPLDAVQFTDHALTRQVAAQSLHARRSPTNTVELSARFINCTDAPLVLGARTNFMDGSERAVEAPSAWKNVILQPRAMGDYRESSLSAEVEHYVIELRNATAKAP